MARKTFTWLEDTKRPSEYEELSTGLQWHSAALVQTDVGNWSPDSTLLRADWDRFRDPAALVYRTYVLKQDASESELDAIFRIYKSAGFNGAVNPDWRAATDDLIGAMAFCEWGVGMAFQHVERFSLSAAIAQSAQLQVMDKLRAAQRFLEWHDVTGGDSTNDRLRGQWISSPQMQPLRKYIELVLAAPDWGYDTVVLNLALEPLRRSFLRHICVEGGRREGDFGASALGSVLVIDDARHALWAGALVDLATDGKGDETVELRNREVVQKWIDDATPDALAAVTALADAHPLDGLSKEALDIATADLSALLVKHGFTPPACLTAGQFDDLHAIA